MSDAERQRTPVLSGDVLPNIADHEQLKALSDVVSNSFGYRADCVIDDKAPTFMTTYNLESQAIQLHISTKLMARFEQADVLDFFVFAVKHELRHIKKYQELPPTAKPTPRELYFWNIVDDAADNLEDMRRSRYFADVTPRVYDTALYPQDKRPLIAEQAKHKQFMESLLMLSMLSDAPTDPRYDRSKLESDLARLGVNGIHEDVMAALADVTHLAQHGRTYNLLEQLRVHGHDYAYRARIARILRSKFDEFYEEDKSEQSAQSDGSGEGEAGEPNFDYSDSGGCQHNHYKHEHSDEKPETKESGEQQKDQTGDKAEVKDEIAKTEIEQLAKKIAKQIQQTADNIETEANAERSDLTPEQLAALKAELNLEDDDFNGYLAARNQYADEIAAFSHLLLQLKRERIDTFLAPSQEVAARGHRIDVGKLVTYIASGSKSPRPDIWKSPQTKEKVEYDFDGLDYYMLCDTSLSMEGEKAKEAAASAVVILEGLINAAQLVMSEEALVRTQIQAFGAGHKTVCELTDSPSLKDLSRTYQTLKNPDSSDTRVAGALEKVAESLEQNASSKSKRLSVVGVISDGQFHDLEEAQEAAQLIAERGTHIIQFVYGSANVSKLTENATVIQLDGAKALPQELFKLLPELLEIMRAKR